MTNLINILIIEDNPADRYLLDLLFREHGNGFSLYMVEDGFKALKFLKKEDSYKDMPLPDLILLDLNLPKIPGHEVLEKIKENPEWKTIPVIILSSSSSEEDIRKSYEHYANSYITKPTDLNDYTHIIDAIRDFWLQVTKLPSGRY